MAHILPSGDLLGHPYWDCPATSAGPAPVPPVPVGWHCPACGHSYAPWVPECHHCPQQPAATPILAAATGTPVAVDLRLAGEWMNPHYQRIVRADGEWREVFQGLQVLLGQPAGNGEALLHFRLTPEGTAGDPPER